MPFRDSLIITQKGAFLQAKDTLSRRFRRVFIKFSFSGCGFIRFSNENVPESTRRRRMQEIVLVVVLRFHVLQIAFEFALDALEGVVDALDVATQVVRDFLIAFPIQIRRQHFLF